MRAETSQSDREDTSGAGVVVVVSSGLCCLVGSPLTTGTPRIDVSLSLLSLVQLLGEPTPAPPTWSYPALPTLPHRVGNMVVSGPWGDTGSSRKDAASASPGRATLGRKGLWWEAPPTGP